MCVQPLAPRRAPGSQPSLVQSIPSLHAPAFGVCEQVPTPAVLTVHVSSVQPIASAQSASMPTGWHPSSPGTVLGAPTHSERAQSVAFAGCAAAQKAGSRVTRQLPLTYEKPMQLSVSVGHECTHVNVAGLQTSVESGSPSTHKLESPIRCQTPDEHCAGSTRAQLPTAGSAHAGALHTPAVHTV